MSIVEPPRIARSASWLALYGNGLRSWTVLCMVDFLFFLAAPVANAHPLSQGAMEIVLGPDSVKIHAVVSSEEVLVASAFDDGKNMSPAEKVRRHAQYLIDHLRVTADGRLLVGRVLNAANEFSSRPVYDLEYGPLGGIPVSLEVEQDVLREIEFAPGNRWEATYLTQIGLAGRPSMQPFLLTCSRPIRFEPGNSEPESRDKNTALTLMFVRQGILHILTGYDHLLFVGALLLAVTTLWDLIKVISAFTVAHTITLALAALDIFRLSGRVIEPMIAASIIFVALQNIFSPEQSRGRSRLIVAFGFGLFHGLGFASGFLEAMSGIGAPAALVPIMAFSVGVEIGHQAVVLPLFGGLRLLRGLSVGKPWSLSLVHRCGSAAISFAGTIYLVAALR